MISFKRMTNIRSKTGKRYSARRNGHTQSGDMWAPLCHSLANEDAFVIAPDLRGIARSSKSDSGYWKADLAEDIFAVLKSLDVLRRPISIVAHDLGANSSKY
ncbi:alpha/beta fold hydrolase [Sphingorhabdus sp. Alg231-15]|uniref:alpha/beta fold hydrolase n=1 Tax=Sphingorhabdus sp. Alg231-15 TaxID=1922222 RepID=UPI00307CA754